MKNLLIDQLFSEISIVISAEIFSTSDSLTVRIILTKSMLMILYCFFHRAVRAVHKNINLSNLIISNSVSQTVRVTSNSDFQAVKIISSTYKSYN